MRKNESNQDKYKNARNLILKISYDLTKYLCKNTNLDRQVHYIVTNGIIKYDNTQKMRIYDTMGNNVNTYIDSVKFIITSMIQANLHNGYHNNYSQLFKDFYSGKNKQYYKILQHLSSKIHSNLYDAYLNYTHDSHLTSAIFCNVSNIKKSTVKSMLHNLLDNFIQCIDKVNIKNELARLKDPKEKQSIIITEFIYSNTQNIKLHRQNNEHSQHSQHGVYNQIIRKNGKIVLVNTNNQSTECKIARKQMPIYMYALIVASQLQLIDMHKITMYDTQVYLNNDYFRFEIKRDEFKKFCEVGTLKKYIKDNVLTLNLNDLIFYQPHKSNEDMVYLYIQRDYIKWFINPKNLNPDAKNESFEMIDINLLNVFKHPTKEDKQKGLKKLTEKETNLFITWIHPKFTYFQNKDNLKVYNFIIDIVKIVNIEYPNAYYRSYKQKIHKAIKTIFKWLETKPLIMSELYVFTYNTDANNKDVYHCEITPLITELKNGKKPQTPKCFKKYYNENKV